MMWVNEIFPPRPRLRWLFITRRLSATSLAGMSRTLVAVGTARLASMFATVRAAAPLSGSTSSTPEELVGTTTPLDADSLASVATTGALAVTGEAGVVCAGTGDAGAEAGWAAGAGAVSTGASEGE